MERTFTNSLKRSPVNRGGGGAGGGGRQCWQFRNLAGAEPELLLYEMIGFYPASADLFCRELRAISAATIHVRINCQGGNVFDGLAIYNALREHPAKIVVHVDGVAASTASWVAMAGDEIRMPDTAYLMIHDPQVYGQFSAEDMRRTIETLDKIKGTIAGIYAERSGLDVQEFLDAMTAETWYSGVDARAKGLADEIEEAPAEAAEAMNRMDLSLYNRVPEDLRKRTAGAKAQGAFNTIREFEAFLRDEGGLTNAAARAVATGGYTALHRDDAAAGDAVRNARDELSACEVIRAARRSWM